MDSYQYSQAEKAVEQTRRVRPHSKKHLQNYLRYFVGLDVPAAPVCKDHAAPLDYLWHVFSADFADTNSKPTHNGDAVVWANRGGGKTLLAAAATLLDCLFKPRCDVRILAGSAQQGSRMYNYLADFVAAGFNHRIDGRMLRDRCVFDNGATVEVLTQSAAGVRGRHVHKLRCDEVELFKPDVLAAAGFITQSTRGIRSGMEMLSTMHRPYGVMQTAVRNAQSCGTPVFRWCIWEVVQACRDRRCSACPLWQDCRGRATEGQGYLAVDDIITQMRRSSRAGFEAEMLCLKPLLDNVVFSDFDEALHVRPLDYNPDIPLYRTIDFGYVNPFVCLWIQIDDDGIVRVIDEFCRSRATVAANAREVIEQTPCPEEHVAATYCDPAGTGRNDVTGTSPVAQLKSTGIRARYRSSSILEGIELIRAALLAGDRKSRLQISPRCPRLIEALQCYHYSDRPAASELPLKDGLYDHPIDALRYFFINRAAPRTTATKPY